MSALEFIGTLLSGALALAAVVYGARKVYQGTVRQTEPLNLGVLQQSFNDAQTITMGAVRVLQEQAVDFQNKLDKMEADLAAAQLRTVELTRDLEIERRDAARVQRELDAAKAEVADLVERLRKAGVPITPSNHQ